MMNRFDEQTQVNDDDDDVTRVEDEAKNEEDDEEQVFFCRFENNKLLLDLLVHLSLDTYKDFECYIEATADGKSSTQNSFMVIN